MNRQGTLFKSTDSPSFDGHKVLIFLITLASLLMAMLYGLFAVTANPIIISVAIALIVGAVLIVNPAWIIWLILSLGLLVTGLLPLFFDFLSTKASWGVSLLGLMLLILALFKMLITPNDRNETPVFVWIAFCFLIYAVINSLIQWYSPGEFLSGFKRYFQVWGLLFALCWFLFDKKRIQHWQAFILMVALVQLPFALYERIVYVPIREGLRSSYPGMVPIDVVGGTFGASLTGGGASAEMATFLIIILAFLLARWRENALSAKKMAVFVPIILAPLLLGETKAVVILLPLMFMVLYRHYMLKKFYYWLIAMIGVVLFVIMAGYLYLTINETKSIDERLESTIDYNLGDKGHGGKSLNRTSVLTFWAEKQGLHDPVSFVFGNGIGSSHGQTGGHVDRQYPYHGIGLTAASTLLWDMGILGFVLYVSILVAAWRSAGKLQLISTDPMVRADAAAIQVVLAIFVFFIFYRITLLETLSFQIIFALLLGYLAWLHRNHIFRKIESIHP